MNIVITFVASGWISLCFNNSSTVTESFTKTAHCNAESPFYFMFDINVIEKKRKKSKHDQEY